MFIAVCALLLGLVVGSFLNVVIHRLPLMLERAWRREAAAILHPEAPPAPAGEPYNLAVPRSACPGCNTPIRAVHNIPLLSWLWLRGRCASCQTAISPRYPAVEAFTGLVSLGVVLHFGPTPLALGALFFSWALIALSFIDIDHQILPDVITLPLLWGGLLMVLLVGPEGGLPTLRDAVIGAMAGYLSLWLVYQAFLRLTGKEGMGHGDFKLLAALGAWLGWQMLPLVILLSAVVGALCGLLLILLRGRDRQQPLPFGPYLAGAGFIALLWGRPLVDGYLRFSGF